MLNNSGSLIAAVTHVQVGYRKYRIGPLNRKSARSRGQATKHSHPTRESRVLGLSLSSALPVSVRSKQIRLYVTSSKYAM